MSTVTCAGCGDELKDDDPGFEAARNWFFCSGCVIPMTVKDYQKASEAGCSEPASA